MKQYEFMQRHQLETFARFLDEHPGFSPLLVGEDALVGGFQIGGSYVTIAEMEKMIAARPRFDTKQTVLLLAAPADGSARER